MGLYPHYLPDLILAGIGTVLAGVMLRWTTRRTGFVLYGAVLLMWAAVFLNAARVSNHFNSYLVAWVRCAGLICIFCVPYAFLIMLAFRRFPDFDPGRRRALTMAAVAVPAAVGTFAIIRRNNLRFKEVDVSIRNLPKDLQGIRIAQLTDVHLSPFVDEAILNRAIGMANETNPHIALVTGDLITSKGDPLDLCIQRLSRLRADAGIWGCLGNHERYALAEDYTQQNGARAGIRFLRNEASELRFGGASLNLAGVDYQRKGTKYLHNAETLIVPGSLNVLLSHSPDVFPVAVKKGFDVTIAGHTHGGQVTLEFLNPALNPARFYTPFVYGLYERDEKKMYVSRGIGTIGLPARLGAPPEVVLIRLCAT